MAHIIKAEKGEKMFDYAIYAIVSPFEPKEVYISKTGIKRLYKTYVEHVNFRVAKTKSLFEQAERENILAPIYLLEEGRTTEKECFRHCVAWFKYFQDHGYEQVMVDVLSDYVEDLKAETKAYYESFKDISLEEVLSPEGGLFPRYERRNNQKKKENNSNVISLRVTPEEYEEIRTAAVEHGLSLGAYCKNMTLKGTITQVDLSFIDKQIEEYLKSKRLLQQILQSFLESGNYFPEDMQTIQNGIDRFTELQERLCDKFTEFIHNSR